MEIPHWTKDAAGLLAQFLSTPTGAAFLANLATHRPSLQPGSFDLTTRALAAAEVSGFERCFSAISSMAVPEKEAQDATPTNYPDLDDDKAWETPRK